MAYGVNNTTSAAERDQTNDVGGCEISVLNYCSKCP